MTADRWTQVVRQQLGLGRLLPLGLARDGAWITEDAAEQVLRRAAAGVPGVRLGRLRIALADPDGPYAPAVPAPPSALAPGPLRVTAEFGAAAGLTALGGDSLPATADRLRLALSEAAAHRLGLEVSEVDLQVTDLLTESSAVTPKEGTEPSAGRVNDVGEAAGPEGAQGAGDAEGTKEPREAKEPKDPEEARIAAVVRAVPGVARLTDALGRSVDISTPDGSDAAVPRRHVRVELAVSSDGRAVDVARAVRTAVAEAARDTPSVAVLVTAVG
ncbi:nucleopolyhedrovirus P10 family protein [Streptomyces sp. NPDC007084]|uniref:nucleopolyhedrovirus P10 family protein n=1 Tax=Streptomyces sp. NPDC007084 TaxID=3154313 RepID=UPI0034526F53